MLRKVAFAFAGLIVAFFLWVNLVNAPRKRETDHTNRQNAERIIAALRAYQHDHGRYPEKLADLETAHLKPVPARIAYPGDTEGRTFDYDVAENGRDFTLGYWQAPFGMLPSDLEENFDSSTGKWKTLER